MKNFKSEEVRTERNTVQATGGGAKKSPFSNVSRKKSEKGTSSADKGIKKTYLKEKNACRVTFRLPKIAASDAKHVHIVGDFNDWKIDATPMKKLKSGDYSVTLVLKTGGEYQFRYLIDENRWENDWHADKYVRSPVGESDNSVVVV